MTAPILQFPPFVVRLAKMSVLDYDHARKAAAKRLDVRASILDKLMQAKRVDGYWTMYDRDLWAMGYAKCK
jgi:hypothetical protein